MLNGRSYPTIGRSPGMTDFPRRSHKVVMCHDALFAATPMISIRTWVSVFDIGRDKSTSNIHTPSESIGVSFPCITHAANASRVLA